MAVTQNGIVHINHLVCMRRVFLLPLKIMGKMECLIRGCNFVTGALGVETIICVLTGNKIRVIIFR